MGVAWLPTSSSPLGLAAALAPVSAPAAILVRLVRSLEPPALMLEGRALAPAHTCFHGLLVITAVATRLVPGAGIASLEELVAYTRRRLLAAGGWPRPTWSEPRWLVIGGVNYLASRGTVPIKVTTGGP